MSGSVSIKAAGISEKGKRESNQDRFLISGTIYDDECPFLELELPALIAVSDGVGGFAGGDMAAEVILKSLSKMDPEGICTKEDLMRQLYKAEEDLECARKNSRKFPEMKASLTGILIKEDQVFVFNCGDCRTLRMRSGLLYPLTRDHSVSQNFIDRNPGLSEAQKHAIRMQNSALTQCFGFPETFDPDVTVIHSPPLPGDRYLLCTDGIWGVLERRLEDYIRQGDAEETVRMLYENAIRKGSSDNCTAIILDIRKGKETA